MTELLDERIVVVATTNDRNLLDRIMQRDGGTSMSATLRRLIRDEARRREIKTPETDDTRNGV